MRLGLRFIVLHLEDKEVQQFADVLTKAELSPQLFKTQSAGAAGVWTSGLPFGTLAGAYPIKLTGRRIVGGQER